MKTSTELETDIVWRFPFIRAAHDLIIHVRCILTYGNTLLGLGEEQCET